MPTTNLLLPFLSAGQAQKHVTVNESLRMLDGIVQLAVKDANLADPPASPSDGDRYIVPAAATGAWLAGVCGRFWSYLLVMGSPWGLTAHYTKAG